MSVTHPAAFRNTVADLVDSTINGGGAAGKLIYRLSGTAAAPGTAVATLTFSATAFGSASSGVITAATITEDSNATGNASPVATVTLETSAGTVVVHAAVAASGSDVDMSNGLTVAAGDTVTCTALTYTAMP